jgi:hypothetical protein
MKLRMVVPLPLPLGANVSTLSSLFSHIKETVTSLQ